MDEQVNIRLNSTANTAGFDQFGNAAKDAAKSSKELGQGLGKAVEVGGATTALMQNLAQASQGGVPGFFALGRAILAFGQIVKGVLLGAGPVGIAIATIGLLIGAAVALKDAFKPAGESADEMARRLADLNKAKLDRITTEQNQLSAATKTAVEEIDKELAAVDKLADLRTSRLIEEEKARGKEKGTPADVVERNIARIRRDAEDAKIGRDLTGAERKARTLEDAASDAEQKRITIDTQRNQLLAMKANLDNADAAMREYRKEVFINTVKRGGASNKAEDVKLGGLYDVRDQARSAIEKRLGGKDKDGELYKAAQKTMDEALQSATTAAQDARKAAEDASTAAAAARAAETQLKPERTKLRTAEDKNARELTDSEKLAIEKRVKRTALSYQAVGSSALTARGDPIDEAAWKLAFPKIPVPTFGPKTPAVLQPSPGSRVLQLGGGTLPSDLATADSRIQIGGGALPSDFAPKDSRITRALNGATEAAKQAPAGEDAAKAAEALQKAQEEAAQRRAAADAAISASLSATGSALAQQGAAINQLTTIALRLLQEADTNRRQNAAARQRLPNT